MKANWSYPTSIRFGAGRIGELADACGEAGLRRPLFVTDAGLRPLAMTESALEGLQRGGVEARVFSGVHPNPTEDDVLRGVEEYRARACDGVVAFGGGSALDAGKCIAFLHGQTRPIWEFEDIGDRWTRADPRVISPVVAVPTTAGTGSEVGRAGVITNEATHEKKIIFHPKMLAAAVIADPELTLGLPPRLTAGAGMDALAHCVEAFCAPTFHPMSDGIALEGMRLISGALARAVADGSDLEARSRMMAAASMGAVAFQKGLGAIHSLSHPIGALYGTHHGMTNAVFLPYVLAFNRSALGTKIDRMCAALGTGPGYDSLLEWTLRLREEIGVPHTLAELGVDDARADLIAERAVADPSTATNPVALTAEGARRIFVAALSGRIDDVAGGD